VAQCVWEEFLKIAKEEVGCRVVDTWFKAVSLYQSDTLNKIVYLQAPNNFVRDWISSNYIELIQFHLGRLLNVEKLKVVFLDGSKKKTPQDSSRDDIACLVPAKLDIENSIVKKTSVKKCCYINTSYQFENFVVGPNNSLAKAAAQAITEKPGILYNPLFIYGGSGLGKTHLLHAIGNCLKEKTNDMSILYQTADRFVSEFISAIRFDKVHKFQLKYHNIDVLLIDDIQFISNKEQTQEAFFHIFNALYDSHKQIVFSSDTFPQNIGGIAERLRSRLACGLVTDIHTPSLETKVAILKKKAHMNNEVILDEIAYLIATSVESNIRELEGALIRVIAFASLTKQSLSTDLAKKVLSHTQETKSYQVEFHDVVKCVNNHYNFNINDLRSKKRNKNLSIARQVAMFLMKKMTQHSLRDIGLFLGGRDHSTVVHALEKIEDKMISNPNFSDQLKLLEQEIRRMD